MKQSQFESLHQPQWDAYRQDLDRLERGKASAEHARSFPRDYRRLCQHLALAQERGYSTYLIDPLQQLALRGHQLLYRHRSSVQVAKFQAGLSNREGSIRGLENRLVDLSLHRIELATGRQGSGHIGRVKAVEFDSRVYQNQVRLLDWAIVHDPVQNAGVRASGSNCVVAELIS